MERYVCVHGHFYQPPRENPWLETVEVESSAYPYHDWNARVTRECYAANGASRILDDAGRILAITNNFGRISFNVGPTLLAWLEAAAPATYQAILAADADSRARFSGHGSAMAQPYNHMIMPLANRRDKLTQVRWGLRDFEHRFGRRPEGMWLPETAVDLETLDVLAQHGIRFTVLAPRQARRTRRAGSRAWRECRGNVDPSTAYRLNLRGAGRSICLFFYDGPISQAVAFEGLLADGGRFADRLLDGFDPARTWPQLMHIATDGETYGHHHRHGDMALAYALERLETGGQVRLTNYGEYLEHHPPAHEVEIHERTSWSCVHGVERWRSDCGCSSGGHPGWRQAWRAPLRLALDWLRDSLATAYEARLGTLLHDPWSARDDYVEVVLDRSPDVVDAFLERHAVRPLDAPQRVEALKLLELQRHAMLMYTSCGWFFDEISGIETVQILRYAARAMQLAEEVLGLPLRERFIELLSAAPSNLPRFADGAGVYRELVAPSVVDLVKVVGHYAISSLFESYGENARVYCYTVEGEDASQKSLGEKRLNLGRVRVSSDLTGESAVVSYAAAHLGGHDLYGAVRAYGGERPYRTMCDELAGAFAHADLRAILRLLDRHFPGGVYTPRLLFRDGQRRVLDMLLQASLDEAVAVFGQLYRMHGPLLHFLRDLGEPLPKPFRTAAEVVLGGELSAAIGAPELDRSRIDALLDEARALDVSLDDAGLGYALEQAIDRLTASLAADPADPEPLAALEALVDLTASLPFPVDLWQAQNVLYGLLRDPPPRLLRDGAHLARLASVGDRLRIARFP